MTPPRYDDPYELLGLDPDAPCAQAMPAFQRAAAGRPTHDPALLRARQEVQRPRDRLVVDMLASPHLPPDLLQRLVRDAPDAPSVPEIDVFEALLVLPEIEPSAGPRQVVELRRELVEEEPILVPEIER